MHDPDKIICDLALSLVLGCEALSDVDALRAEPGVYGRVASDPTVSRLISTVAGDADKAVQAISTARQQARARVWDLAGVHAPDRDASIEAPLVIDLDASLITAHSDKQKASPRSNEGSGHPLLAFADHGPQGTGEALVAHLLPRNAGSNITVNPGRVAATPRQEPTTRQEGAGPRRRGRRHQGLHQLAH